MSIFRPFIDDDVWNIVCELNATREHVIDGPWSDMLDNVYT